MPATGVRVARLATVLMLVAACALPVACTRRGVEPALPARPAVEMGEALRQRLDAAEQAVLASPSSAEARVTLGKVYFANGFASLAVTCFRQALGGQPADRGATSYLLAVAADAAGDSEQALQALRLSLEHAPRYVPALLRFAELTYKRGDAAAAIESYEKALAIETDCPEALLTLAREKLRQGEDASALALLDRLEASHPEYGSGLSLQAQVLERRGKRGEADALRKRGRVRKDPPMRDPLLADTMLACVDVQRLGIQFEDALNASRIDEALAILDRMQTLEPDHWLAHRMRGFTYAHSGRHEMAVTEYRAALQRGADPALVYPGLASALIKLGRLGEAARTVQEGLAKAPNATALLILSAELHLKRGETREAETMLTRALASDDRDLGAHRLLAKLRSEQGQSDAALPHWETLVRLDPSELGARVALGQYHLERAQPEKALPPLQQAMQLAPENEDVRNLLSVAWLRVGNQQARAREFDAALLSFDAALAARADATEPFINKIRVLAFMRRHAEAVAAADTLVRIHPDDPAAALVLGDMQQAAGDEMAAKASWTRASELARRRADADSVRAAVARRLEAAR